MAGLKDKIVLITGASSGIGRETSILFAKQGARLAITGRNEDNLKKTADLCKAEGLKDADLFLLTGDLTKEEDVNKIVDGAAHKLGGIDSVVNNAGTGVNSRFADASVEQFDNILSCNARSVFMVTKRALPHLIKSKGTIVNVSSVAGNKPFIAQFSYSVSKAALNHMTTLLAAELAENGIRVNCVSPGCIKTEIFTREGNALEGMKMDKADQFFEKIAQMHPLKRVGTVEEVAQLILYLASDASVNVTGANIPIDGGLHFSVSVRQ